MTILISEVYEAFIDAGVSEEKARKAAEALSEDKQRLTKLEVLVGVNVTLTLGCLWGIIKIISG